MRDYKIPYWWIDTPKQKTTVFEHVVVVAVSLAIAIGLFLVVV